MKTFKIIYVAFNKILFYFKFKKIISLAFFYKICLIIILAMSTSCTYN